MPARRRRRGPRARGRRAAHERPAPGRGGTGRRSRRAHLDEHAWRHGVLKVAVHGHPRSTSSRGSTSAPTHELARMAARLRRPSAGAAGRAVTVASTAVATTPPRRPPSLRPLRREADHANLRPSHPHERAHHRRLRGDVRRRRARRRRAVVLARSAAHERGQFRRLLRRADRLGAVPRRAVRHPSPRHDRPEPEGGQRPALP